MIRYVTAVVGVLMFAFGALAQSSPPQHQHAVTPTNLIDGAVHPELIPDSVAYRLYFAVVSESPSPLPNEARRQHAHLSKAGLAEQDIQAASKVLANFKLAYAALIYTYNHSPEVLNNTNNGLQLFLAKRDALVQETRNALQAALSPAGMALLDDHIQREKAHMKVAAKEAGQ